jgi:hypothetical protein
MFGGIVHLAAKTLNNESDIVVSPGLTMFFQFEICLAPVPTGRGEFFLPEPNRHRASQGLGRFRGVLKQTIFEILRFHPMLHAALVNGIGCETADCRSLKSGGP